MFFAGNFVEVEITRDAMDGGWDSRDDGDVVGVREGGHGALSCGVEARLEEFGEVWNNAICTTSFEVLGIESIDADDDCWLLGEMICTPVEFDCVRKSVLS